MRAAVKRRRVRALVGLAAVTGGGLVAAVALAAPAGATEPATTNCVLGLVCVTTPSATPSPKTDPVSSLLAAVPSAVTNLTNTLTSPLPSVNIPVSLPAVPTATTIPVQIKPIHSDSSPQVSPSPSLDGTTTKRGSGVTAPPSAETTAPAAGLAGGTEVSQPATPVPSPLDDVTPSDDVRSSAAVATTTNGSGTGGPTAGRDTSSAGAQGLAAAAAKQTATSSQRRAAAAAPERRPAKVSTATLVKAMSPGWAGLLMLVAGCGVFVGLETFFARRDPKLVSSPLKTDLVRYA